MQNQAGFKVFYRIGNVDRGVLVGIEMSPQMNADEHGYKTCYLSACRYTDHKNIRVYLRSSVDQ
jgi:hypothetical protein